jgi:hypothetical protein
LVASGLNRKVITANVVVGVLAVTGVAFFVQDVKQAELFYALGFSAYLLFLHFLCRPGIDLAVVILVSILSPLAIVGAAANLFWGVLYMCLLLVMAIWKLRLRPKDIRGLRF